MNRRGFLGTLGTIVRGQQGPLRGSAEAGMPVAWDGWRPELVADLVGIDALWVETDRTARSDDARGLSVRFLRDAREAPLTIHRVQLPWTAVSGGLYVRGPVSFRARLAVTLDGPPHTATHLIFQRRASVKVYLATVRVGERAVSKVVAILRQASQPLDLQ